MKHIDKELLVGLYENGLSLIQIGEKFSLNYNTVKYHLLKMGVKLRPKGRYKTYEFNENFFSVPNKLNSYWAGFIAADFCLRRHGGKRKLSELSCSLGAKDKKQLERFMSDIGHCSAVGTRWRKRKGKSVLAAEISITSNKMLDDLLYNYDIRAGKKTERLEPPLKLDVEYRLPFIVGYIDGDGWLQYKRYLNLGVCGTFQMVSWIKDVLDKELSEVGIECTGDVTKRANLAVWRANIHSWYLASLLEGVSVAKMDRKLPQIYKYFELHKKKFTKKSLLEIEKCQLLSKLKTKMN